MQIDGWTFALQAANFLVLIWLLRRFLYRPVKEVIEKRKQLAEQAFVDADKEKTAAKAARQGFEQDRSRLERERQEMLKAIHTELEAERGKVIDEAAAKAGKLLEVARQTIVQERHSALTQLREQAAALAVDLASGLLRQGGSGIASGVFLAQLEQYLKDMPAEERERLQHDLAANNARLRVVTALALTPQAQDQWTARLKTCFAQRETIDFAAQPEILGGAELHFPHAVLKLTWAEQLHKAQDVLRQDDVAS